MAGETVTVGMEEKVYCLQKKSLPWKAYSHFDTPPKPGRFQHPPAKWIRPYLVVPASGSIPLPSMPKAYYKVGPRHDRYISGVIYNPYK